MLHMHYNAEIDFEKLTNLYIALSKEMGWANILSDWELVKGLIK